MNKNRIIFFLFFMMISVSAYPDKKTTLDIRKATVKIIKTFIRPDYCVPWKMQNYSSTLGSGVIINGNLILTNAHVVSDATFLEIQKENDPNRYEAEVVHVGHECDLAILRVEGTEFFNDTIALDFGELPDLKSVVTTYGYPVGGERISITEGVVSRIEIGVYSHSRKSALLMIQTDAAINPGNSGGPVIQNGKIAGIAFQARTDANNIGYMIPVVIINHFLNDIADGVYDGFPDLGIFTEDLVNKSYRSYAGIPDYLTGIVVANVVKGSASGGFLRENDIILSIDGNRVANDGSIAFGDGRIKYSFIVDNKQIGEDVTVELFRDKKPLTVTFPLKGFPERIPWYNEYEIMPRYFIFGGIVFQPLNREFLECWEEWWFRADRRLLYYFSFLERDDPAPEKTEIVLINHILPDDSNTYFSGIGDVIVNKINGITINCLDDVVSAFKNNTGEFHVVEVEGDVKPLILKAGGIEETNRRIIEKYGIPSDRRLIK